MQIENLALSGIKLITPKVFADDRGFFLEPWNASRFRALGLETDFVQDNHSRSSKHTIRGLHMQLAKGAVPGQAKLIRCARGSILDVVVDARPWSKTFKQHLAVQLDDVKHQQLFIPVGFAHGFCVLSDIADVCYKVTSLYDPSTVVDVQPAAVEPRAVKAEVGQAAVPVEPVEHVAVQPVEPVAVQPVERVAAEAVAKPVEPPKPVERPKLVERQKPVERPKPAAPTPVEPTRPTPPAPADTPVEPGPSWPTSWPRLPEDKQRLLVQRCQQRPCTASLLKVVPGQLPTAGLLKLQRDLTACLDACRAAAR